MQGHQEDAKLQRNRLFAEVQERKKKIHLRHQYMESKLKLRSLQSLKTCQALLTLNRCEKIPTEFSFKGVIRS